jgi:hypothetical protein
MFAQIFNAGSLGGVVGCEARLNCIATIVAADELSR